MRALILAFALVACSGGEPADTAVEAPASTQTESAEAALAALPNWGNAREAGVDFRAVGQEPGWILDIYQQGRITLLWDYGENRMEFPLPSPTYPQEGQTRYESEAGGHTLLVTTHRTPCEDVMSGEGYPARVDVEIDGRSLHGCGRSV